LSQKLRVSKLKRAFNISQRGDIAALLLLKTFRYIEKGALCPYALAQQHNLLNSPEPQIINRQQPPFAVNNTNNFSFFSCSLGAARPAQASKRCVDFTLLWQKAHLFSLVGFICCTSRLQPLPLCKDVFHVLNRELFCVRSVVQCDDPFKRKIDFMGNIKCREEAAFIFTRA
jgi:hypothetical protein